MSRTTLGIDEPLSAYIQEMGVRERDIHRRVRQETGRMPKPNMQSAPEQGALMCILAKLAGAQKILEIGTFTGYATLWLAEGMVHGGRLLTLENDETHAEVARRYFEESGYDDRIELRVGDANAVLDELIGQGEAGQWDMAFIDAEKTEYDGYYERCLQLMRPGGLLMLDNTLRYGRVADESINDPDTVAIRNLNTKIQNDARVEVVIVPVADGLTLALKC